MSERAHRGGPRRWVAALLCLGVACSSAGGSEEPRLRTVFDDERVGREAAEEVVEQMGLLGNAELDAYVTRVGQRVAAVTPDRRFEYTFQVVDRMEPNAFVLPGGFIFVTRGMMALLNDEDELACLMGHEIVHAESRHAARRQALDARMNPMLGRWSRAGAAAAYSREMEREADERGQRLCAAAGYDPMGMSTLFASLDRAERLRFGFSREPSFLDTHPGSRERRVESAGRAGKLRWERDPDRGEPRFELLRRIEGLDVGQRPEAGLFVDQRFLDPVRGFQISFPLGWQLSATNQVVGARSPDAGTVVFVVADQAPGDPEARAEEWYEELEEAEEKNLQVDDSRPTRIGSLEAWRLDLSGRGFWNGAAGHATFFTWGDATYRIIAVAPSRRAREQLRRTRTATRSFRALTEENRGRIRAHRLRVVAAEPGESLAELARRTGDAGPPARLALQNALFSNHVFAGGELVKTTRVEPFP